jgi:tRNA (guanine-N7-)-methyltransferase
MKGTKSFICRAEKMPHPNPYVRMLSEDFAEWTFTEEAASDFRGRWRSDVFAVTEETPLDLEIGTGNGTHFAHIAKDRPHRALLGLELKYKPLVQSIRRARRLGCKNARMLRYNASALGDIFSEGELNQVFIHFPDPWPRKSQWKNRLIQSSFLECLFRLQQPQSTIEFKTDNQDYFKYAMERFQTSPYQIIGYSEDLHRSSHVVDNFVTQFESLFLRQGLPIYFARLQRLP